MTSSSSSPPSPVSPPVVGCSGKSPPRVGPSPAAGDRQPDDLGPVEYHPGLTGQVAGQFEDRDGPGLVKPQGFAENLGAVVPGHTAEHLRPGHRVVVGGVDFPPSHHHVYAVGVALEGGDGIGDGQRRVERQHGTDHTPSSLPQPDPAPATLIPAQKLPTEAPLSS